MFIQFLVCLIEEEIGKEQNIFFPFFQIGHTEGKFIDTMIKVFTEFTLTHHLWEDLNRTTRKFLEGVTLAGMVEAHAARHGKQVVSAVIPVRKHA